MIKTTTQLYSFCFQFSRKCGNIGNVQKLTTIHISPMWSINADTSLHLVMLAMSTIQLVLGMVGLVEGLTVNITQTAWTQVVQYVKHFIELKSFLARTDIEHNSYQRYNSYLFDFYYSLKY